MPAEPGYVMFINEDGSQPRMRIRVHLDNTLTATDDPVSDATFIKARGMTIPKQGPDLPDGNVLVSVIDGSEFTLRVASSHITIKCLANGSPIIGETIVFNIARVDASVVSITDDSDSLIIDIPASIKMTVSVSFDGAHFGNAHAIRIE